MARLADAEYLAFPFRVDAGGARVCGRSAHVRQQIEQVLFTTPGERVFRPEFGAGLRRMVFEPNSSDLRELTRKRLVSALADVLQGEVDPRTLLVEVEGEGENLRVLVSYTLAAIGRVETHVITAGG